MLDKFKYVLFKLICLKAIICAQVTMSTSFSLCGTSFLCNAPDLRHYFLIIQFMNHEMKYDHFYETQ